MTYSLDLKSAWLKLNHANGYIEDLWSRIRDTLDNGKAITLGRQFDSKDNSIVISVVKIEKVPEDWSLIFGDAAYNLRCSLDHLAWQLAIREFNGVEPQDLNVIKLIQFPIAMTKRAWDSHVNRKYLSAADSAKLEKFQPFSRTHQLWPIAPLAVLCGKNGLQNIDKHRSVHLAYMAPHALRLTGEAEPRGYAPIKLTDCALRLVNGSIEVRYNAAPRPLYPGDEISRIPVVPTGPNPDMEFNSNFSFYVAVGKNSVPVIDALVQTARIVEEILREFS